MWGPARLTALLTLAPCLATCLAACGDDSRNPGPGEQRVLDQLPKPAAAWSTYDASLSTYGGHPAVARTWVRDVTAKEAASACQEVADWFTAVDRDLPGSIEEDAEQNDTADEVQAACLEAAERGPQPGTAATLGFAWSPRSVTDGVRYIASASYQSEPGNARLYVSAEVRPGDL